MHNSDDIPPICGCWRDGEDMASMAMEANLMFRWWNCRLRLPQLLLHLALLKMNVPMPLISNPLFIPPTLLFEWTSFRSMNCDERFAMHCEEWLSMPTLNESVSKCPMVVDDGIAWEA